ncbi:MAG TPA: mobile mystery protein A [Acidimicrobiia bacterium]|nr:mobile mystery protein A [Acidimicrobiia bacterium]
MRRTERAALARRTLDERFSQADPRLLRDRPTRGWVRAVRDALGMTSGQLAARLGVSQVAVTKLERSEIADSARLETLRRAADALDCELVYAFVPRSSLEDIVQRRALALARDDIQSVDRSMRLEAQGLAKNELEARVRDYADHLVVEGRLWDEHRSAASSG